MSDGVGGRRVDWGRRDRVPGGRSEARPAEGRVGRRPAATMTCDIDGCGYVATGGGVARAMRAHVLEVHRKGIVTTPRVRKELPQAPADSPERRAQMEAQIPGEMVTRPRWRCPELGLVEHVGERERGPGPAEKRLMKRVREVMGWPPGRKKGLPAIEYRAGFIPGGRPGPA